MKFQKVKVLRTFPVALTLILIKVVVTSAATTTMMGEATKNLEQQHTLHRTIRSPQLFSGRNVLPDFTKDLTQFNPPMLSELKDFKDKMANLANLTALLEHAIAAEKTARTSLQSFVNTIKEQIIGVQKAVNPDPENYWAESKVCGGILVSQTGRILYKPNDYYQNHERCTWTIRTNHRSKVRVTLNNGDMEENHDYVAVTELIDSNPTNIGAKWNTVRLIPGQTILFEGPLIFINFISDGSIRRKGFQLEFEGMGSNINIRTMYQHFHFSDWMGRFDSHDLNENLEKQNKVEKEFELVTTVMVNPSNWNASRLLLSITMDKLDLRPNECAETSLAVLNEFAVFPRGSSQRCCGEVCEASDYQSANGVVLGILKSSKWMNDSQFEINWSTDTRSNHVESIDKCGGLLTGISGKISYKENKQYNINERCVWIIQNDNMTEGEIKVQLVKDGFEQMYDFVTLSFLKHDDKDENLKTKFLYKSGAPVQIQAPFVLVEFYSDAATFGKAAGFELIWEIKQTSDKTVHFELDYNNEEDGSKLMSCSAQHKENNVGKIFVINSNQGTNHSKLTLDTADDPFVTEEFSLFVSEGGNFSKVKSSDGYESKDGIFVTLRKCSASSREVSVKWKTEEASDAGESTSDQIFVKSEDKCGEMLFGDSGRIVYKMGKEYDLNERCTWIIRPKTLSTITVQLMADGFESCCDGIQMNKIDISAGVIDPEGTSISRENRFQSIDAAALLITFVSDHSVKGTGFVLEFQTKGEIINDAANEIDLKHLNVKLDSRPNKENPFGPIILQTSDNLVSIDTFVFQHVEIASENIIVELQLENLEIQECNQDSVALYHMPTLGKYELLKIIPSEEHCSIERLAGRNPLSKIFTPEEEKVQLEPKGVLVSITKISTGKADKTLSLKFE